MQQFVPILHFGFFPYYLHAVTLETHSSKKDILQQNVMNTAVYENAVIY